MFANAIELVSNFTRPVNSILRIYRGKSVIPGSATLFFVNEDGYAVTCKHVVSALLSAEGTNQHFAKFKKERDALPKDGKFKAAVKGMEIKYKYNDDTVIQAKNTFVDCIDMMSGFTTHEHPNYDLAIIRFNGFNKTLYSG